MSTHTTPRCQNRSRTRRITRQFFSNGSWTFVACLQFTPPQEPRGDYFRLGKRQQRLRGCRMMGGRTDRESATLLSLTFITPQSGPGRRRLSRGRQQQHQPCSLLPLFVSCLCVCASKVTLLRRTRVCVCAVGGRRFPSPIVFGDPAKAWPIPDETNDGGGGGGRPTSVFVIGTPFSRPDNMVKCGIN